jgi:hypothetical protein
MDESFSLPLTEKSTTDQQPLGLEPEKELPEGFRAAVLLILVLTALIGVLLIHQISMAYTE